MKIILASSAYSPTVGGLQKVAQELAGHWKAQGHEVAVITSRTSGKLPRHEILNGISVSRYYFLWEFPHAGFLSIPKFILQGFLLLCSLPSLWSQLSPKKCDLISLHYVGPPALWIVLMAKLRSVPLVVTLHGSDLLIEANRSRWKNWILRRTLESARGISTVSKFMLSEMEKFYPSVRGQAKVIYNGLEANDFKNIPACHRSSPFALCVARLSLQKGQLLLVDAFERFASDVSDLDLVLAGDGPSRKIIEGRILRSPVSKRICLEGSLDYPSALSLIRSASLVVIPSSAEPFGLVALEARMLRRPIVALRRGALPEVLAGYAGILWVDEENPEKLAQTMLEAMKWVEINSVGEMPFVGWETVARSYLEFFSASINHIVP